MRSALFVLCLLLAPDVNAQNIGRPVPLDPPDINGGKTALSAGNIAEACHQMLERPASLENVIETWVCIGFVSGFMQGTMMAAKEITGDPLSMPFCIPRGDTYEANARAFRDFVVKNHSMRDYPAGVLLMAALKDRYQCPAQPAEPAPSQRPPARRATKQGNSLACPVIRAGAERRTIGSLFSECEKLGLNRQRCLGCLEQP